MFLDGFHQRHQSAYAGQFTMVHCEGERATKLCATGGSSLIVTVTVLLNFCLYVHTVYINKYDKQNHNATAISCYPG